MIRILSLTCQEFRKCSLFPHNHNTKWKMTLFRLSLEFWSTGIKSQILDSWYLFGKWCTMPAVTKMEIQSYSRTLRICRPIILWSNRPTAPLISFSLPLFCTDKWLLQLPLIRAFPAYSSAFNSRLYTRSIERSTLAELVTHALLSGERLPPHLLFLTGCR